MLSKKILILVALVTSVALVTVTIISYFSPEIRLEHFSFEFAIISVIINALFLWALLEQISLGRKSLNVANAANEITRRIGVDERNPSLVPVVEMGEIQFANHGNGIVSQIGSAVFNYILPKDNDVTLSFRVIGSLRNEGKTTARLHSQGNVTFDKDSIAGSELVWGLNNWQEDEEVLLGPGESIDFAWIDGHTIPEWYESYVNNTEGDQSNFDENCSCKIQFRYWDFQHNAYDYIDIELQGYPIRQDESDRGHYYLDPNGLKPGIYPTQRLYGDTERTNYKNPYDYRRNVAPKS